VAKISSVPSFLFWSLATASSTPAPAQAKTVNNIRPDIAFTSLVKAREELNVVSKKYLSSKDYSGLRTYLSDDNLNINRYEENATSILSSKALDLESKKEIGTIRRYGVGADVMIMYGGLLSEIDEENDVIDSKAASKALQRAMDSLDEVIYICRSNGM